MYKSRKKIGKINVTRMHTFCKRRPILPFICKRKFGLSGFPKLYQSRQIKSPVSILVQQPHNPEPRTRRQEAKDRPRQPMSWCWDQQAEPTHKRTAAFLAIAPCACIIALCTTLTCFSFNFCISSCFCCKLSIHLFTCRPWVRCRSRFMSKGYAWGLCFHC